MQIRTKLVIAVWISMGIVAAIAGSTIRAASERNIRLNAEAAVASGGAAFASVERADVDKLSATLAAILADVRYQAAFERRDRKALAALADPLFQEVRSSFGITHWYFHLPDRTVFLRVHRPEQFGDAVERSTMLEASRGGVASAGKELGRNAFALRVVRPWIVGGELVGYVELGEEIDDFLQRMKRQTGDEYELLVEKRQLDEQAFAAVRQVKGLRNDWHDHPTLVVIDSTVPGVACDCARIDELAEVPEGGVYLGEEGEERGKVFARGVLPVKDASGARVGLLVVRSDISVMHGNTTRARSRVIAAVIALALASAAFLAFAIDRLVHARLRRMTALVEDVAARLVGGDYDVASAIPPPKVNDEIGSFEIFFGRFVAVVGETLQGLLRKRG